MPINIKELRQQEAELTNEIKNQKKLGLQLMDNPAGPDGKITDEQNTQF